MPNTSAIRCDKMWLLGISRNRTAPNQKKPIARKPARNEAQPFIRMNIDTPQATMAMVHHGRKYSAIADKTAMIMIVTKNLISY